jgi:hypothetical protein
MYLKGLYLTALVAMFMTTSIVQADAGIGAGVTYVFRQGVAVGVKLFSNDKEDKVVGTAGLDYMLGTGSWRPNVGIGYLGDKVYGDINASYNFQSGIWDFGVGAGAADTEDKSTAISVPKPTFIFATPVSP